MATGTPGRRRLILCGICFEPDCPWSKWVDDDGGISMDIVDEMHMIYIGQVHDEIEKRRASKLTTEEKQSKIDSAIEQIAEETGQSVEIQNLDELLGKEVKRTDSEHQTAVEKDLTVDDLLKQFQQHIEKNEGGEQQQQKH